MKERIILDKEKVIAFRPKGLDVYSQEYVEEIDIIENTKKVEQVPETFEELKELCKGIKGNKRDCGGAMWFEFPIPKDSTLWLGKFLCVDIKGQVGIAEKSFGDDISITIFSEHRTFAQMWQIIKNLVGE